MEEIQPSAEAPAAEAVAAANGPDSEVLLADIEAPVVVPKPPLALSKFRLALGGTAAATAPAGDAAEAGGADGPTAAEKNQRIRLLSRF